MSTGDYVFEALAILLLIALWVTPLLIFQSLPESIPSHFNAGGRVDGWGDRMSLFVLPAIAFLLFVLLTVVNRYPHKFNYLVEITPENARFQYTRATRLIRFLKVFIVLLFLYIELQILRSARQIHDNYHLWLILTIPFAAVVMPVFLAIYLSRDKGSE